VTKNILAVLFHIVALCAVVVVFGKSAFDVPDPSVAAETSGVDPVFAKFTGELERNTILRVLENDTAIKQGYFDKLLEAFNAKYAEYGIVAVDANMDQYADLENDGPYGYGPDVLYQANDILMRYVDGNHITPVPVETLGCYAETAENAWTAYANEDYYYGVPVNVQAPVLYYRKDLLPENWQTDWDNDKNGVPDMIESHSSLYAYSKMLKESSGGKKFGYMKSLLDVYFSSGYLFSYGGYVFGDNGNNTEDIGFAAGNAALGGQVVKQLASVMNEDCIDYTVTTVGYSKMAAGDYFATIATPDVYTLFIQELTAVYEGEGLSHAEAEAKAMENIVAADIPTLPASGDLNEENPELIPYKMMGGVNGYAISSYTTAPNAALAFIDFATNMEMVMLRNEILGVVPARSDAAEKVGGLSDIVNKNLKDGNVVVMPSVRAVAQVWTPGETFFSDLAKDAFRPQGEQKYKTLEEIKSGLEKVDEQIYAAINTLR
jgi:arabinogalactan oligomer/maltooligosaccharide transport system substrate-binding protein